jgi:Tfp pilus assembly protein PilP
MTIIVGFLLAAIAPGLTAQTNPAATKQIVQNAVGGTKPAQTTQQPASKPPAKPAAKPAGSAPAQQKPGAQAAAPKGGTPKAAAQKPATSASKTSKKPAARTRAAEKKPAEGTDNTKIARRDPFESLVARQAAAAKGGQNLPPGKAGLQVSTLRVDGIVKASNGMIAVVTNPQSRTYFLREGDRLYDGAVEKISMDGVTFHEEGKDAFGKPVERSVNKRIYSMAGEQQ